MKKKFTIEDRTYYEYPGNPGVSNPEVPERDWRSSEIFQAGNPDFRLSHDHEGIPSEPVGTDSQHDSSPKESGNNGLVLQFTPQGIIEYISDRAIHLLKLTPREVLGKNISVFAEILGIRNSDILIDLQKDFRAQHLTEIYVEGEKKWLLWDYEARINFDATIGSVIATGREITDFIAPNTSIVLEKNRDFLTGLWNRTGLYEQMFKLEDQTSHAVSFFIDCWSLSKITDYYGYHVSDEVIVLMTRELKRMSRPDWLLSRYSDNQFVIVCMNEGASPVEIEKMLDELEMNIISLYNIREMNFQIDKRIGYAVFPDDTRDLSKLVSCSSLAMKESIKLDQITVKRYQKYMSEALEQNVLYAGKLRDALERDEVEIYFQKIINVGTDEVVLFEELARWNDRQLGNISPKTMFTIAKESNLIDRLERYLVNKALCAIKQVTGQMEYRNAKLSLNITPSSLLEPRFLDFLDEKVLEYGLKPETLCIEICESTFVNSLDLCIERINEFKQHGYGIAIDDFGREYSSLAVLENVAFDIIKVDAVFVNRIALQKNQEIIKMITRIAEMANQVIVAEGVETLYQKNILKQLGCFIQQGYYFNRPQRISSLLK